MRRSASTSGEWATGPFLASSSGMRRLIVLLPAALLMTATGCFQYHTVKKNTPKTAEVKASRAQLLRAVLEIAHQRGWFISELNVKTGWVVALTPTDRSHGFVTRYRWIFSASNGTLTTKLSLDSFSGGSWRSQDQVCDGYTYARERSVLAEVTSRVDPENDSAFVGRRLSEAAAAPRKR